MKKKWSDLEITGIIVIAGVLLFTLSLSGRLGSVPPSMHILIILATIVIFVFLAYVIIRFLFRLVSAKAAPEETAAETALRRTRSFMGFFTIACISLALWFLYRGINSPMTPGSWSSGMYYFWAVVIGIGGILGGGNEYFSRLTSKPCPLCKQNIRKDAVRCNHCGGALEA